MRKARNRKDKKNSRLREEMLKQNVTQTELAEHLGIKQNTFSAYVNEKSPIPSDYLIQICQYLKVSSDYLLGLSDKEESYNDEFIMKELNLSKEAIKTLKYAVLGGNSDGFNKLLSSYERDGIRFFSLLNKYLKHSEPFSYEFQDHNNQTIYITTLSQKEYLLNSIDSLLRNLDNKLNNTEKEFNDYEKQCDCLDLSPLTVRFTDALKSKIESELSYIEQKQEENENNDYSQEIAFLEKELEKIEESETQDNGKN